MQLHGEELETARSRPFWQGLRDGTLMLQRCGRCGRFQHYPRPICRTCHSRELAWRACSGRGTLFARTKVHRTSKPYLQARTPFELAIVRVEEGPLLMGLLAGAKAGSSIGQAARIDFEATRRDGLISFSLLEA